MPRSESVVCGLELDLHDLSLRNANHIRHILPAPFSHLDGDVRLAEVLTDIGDRLSAATFVFFICETLHISGKAPYFFGFQ